MGDICAKCGLPAEICVCEEIARESQDVQVYTVRRRYGKIMTIIEGINTTDIDIDDLARTLKTKCASGGTVKEGNIELQVSLHVVAVGAIAHGRRGQADRHDLVEVRARHAVLHASVIHHVAECGIVLEWPDEFLGPTPQGGSGLEEGRWAEVVGQTAVEPDHAASIRHTIGEVAGPTGQLSKSVVRRSRGRSVRHARRLGSGARRNGTR